MKGKRELKGRERIRMKRQRRRWTIFLIICLIMLCLILKAFWNWQQRTKEHLGNIVSVVFEEMFGGVVNEEIGNFTEDEGEIEETEQPIEEQQYKVKVIKKKKLLARHTIDNPYSYGNRNTNMKVAAKIINKATGGKKGYVLQPDEKFSWLETVGDTTPEKGFLLAGVIVNRVSTQGYGGGVCQVSSTIYSAAYHAGLIKQGHYYAQSHSIKSLYIHPEEGDKEATVSFSSGVDFWFENILKKPIRIKMNTKNDKVTVKIFKLMKKKVKIPIEN